MCTLIIKYYGHSVITIIVYIAVRSTNIERKQLRKCMISLNNCNNDYTIEKWKWETKNYYELMP